MAVSKVILNGDTLIDVTQKTVTSASMLSGTTALKNDGTDITGSIASKTSSDLTASGATVTAPAGYYASSASKSVASGSATTPATSITANPTISVNSSGLITASVSTTKSITPTVSAGYVSSGTAGTATVSGSATSQLSTQAAQTIHPSTTDQTIASGKYLTGAQTVKGVLLTNLTAENIKKDVVVKVGDSTDDDCVTSVTGTLEGGGGGMSEADLKEYIRRGITDIDWPSGMTFIGNYAFAGCASFNPDSLPSILTSINNYAFYGCNRLALTSLPSGITSIAPYAFQNCAALALTSLPNGITSIQASSFSGCNTLALTSLPSGVTSLNNSAFAYCYSLTLSTLPSSITYIGNYAFQCCENITTISCDGEITSFNVYAFNGSSSHPMKLASASFPNVSASSFPQVFGSTTAANACQLLEFADIGSSQSIAANAFANCYALETLVLRRSDAICSLSNVSAFTNTPMSGYNSKTGTVYVPSALISTYQTATNWSTLYNNGTVTFSAIEGSDYELD